ncbi:MAG: hypothetical protein HC888_03315 [Candidatus Competibacteraceae bacterium]|nr:hypothetical protein [Candidatus Competibacteraceae bacterium]
MSWNYRIVKLADGGYAIHEVYYDKGGKPNSMTKDAITFGGDTPEEVSRQIEMAYNDAKKHPVFIPPDNW